MLGTAMLETRSVSAHGEDATLMAEDRSSAESAQALLSWSFDREEVRMLDLKEVSYHNTGK